MTATAAAEESLLVFVDGVAQPTSAFTLSSSGVGIGANSQLDEINVSPALATGQQLRVCHLGINTAIADGSITGAKITMGADAAGDLLYHNGTQYDRFPIGTKGQLFATNGAANAPEWILGDDAGDILFYNGTNYEKLGIGTAGQLLATNPGATAPYWLNADNQNLPSVGASGNVLTSDATNWSSQPPLGGVGGELVSIQTFTTAGNGTWTRPSGVKRILVHAIGAGGGLLITGSAQTGSGAGGGGCCIKVYDVSDVTSFPFRVGVGAVGAGGATYFTNTDGAANSLSLQAGGGGAASESGSGGTPGAGGGAVGGDINLIGGAGGSSGNGHGGQSAWAGGNIGKGSEGGNQSVAGTTGMIVVYEYSDVSASLVGEKLVSSQLLTASSGTWTRPANITKIEVWVVGGGGNSTNTSGSAYGGGGGGTAYSILDVTNLATAAYTVGGASVNSTFVGATTLTGVGGADAGDDSFGAGGTATGGQINYAGSPGGYTSPQYTHPMEGHSQFGGIFGNGAVGGGGNGATRNGTAGCVYIKEYSDASLVSGGSLVPTGVLNPYAGATAPAGWLLCFGQAISRTVYSTLFTAIGTTYGVGDGSTTFLLPDMRGRVAAGKDNMGGTSADRLQLALGGLDGDTLGAAVNAEIHTHAEAGAVGALPQWGGGLLPLDYTSNLQPTIILNYIIKT